MKIMVRTFAGFCTALFLTISCTTAMAQQWPNKAVRLVVPYPAGGTTDVLGRFIADKLSEKLGQPVVVENRSGAGGIVGSAAVAKAAPDGYTYVLGTIGSHGVNYALNPNMAYHPLKDFEGVVSIAAVPNVLVVRSEQPYKTLKDLLDDARARPGVLTHGSSGIGASPQLSLAVMKMMAGVNINEIMYKGSAPAMVDLLGGHVVMAFDGIVTSLPHIKNGTLRPLAVSSKERVKVLADVPSVSEALPGFDVVAWYGIWAPVGTPDAIIQKMNREINLILNTPEFEQQLFDIGAQLMGGDVKSFREMHRREFDRWVDFIKKTGLKPE